jgi:broad specificity phosphatase PhoE
MSAAPIFPSCLRFRLVLVRHGESVLGREGRYAGTLDTPLTPKGRRQIRGLREQFERLRPDLVFSSDLIRCRETASLLAPGRNIYPSRSLRELNFGAWEGLTAEECRLRDPERFDRWMRVPWSERPPRGESLDQLWSRARGFATTLARRHPGKTIVLVTHGGPIRALLADDPTTFWSVHASFGALLETVWDGSRSAAVTPPRR